MVGAGWILFRPRLQHRPRRATPSDPCVRLGAPRCSTPETRRARPIPRPRPGRRRSESAVAVRRSALLSAPSGQPAAGTGKRVGGDPCWRLRDPLPSSPSTARAVPRRLLAPGSARVEAFFPPPAASPFPAKKFPPPGATKARSPRRRCPHPSISPVFLAERVRPTTCSRRPRKIPGSRSGGPVAVARGRFLALFLVGMGPLDSPKNTPSPGKRQPTKNRPKYPCREGTRRKEKGNWRKLPPDLPSAIRPPGELARRQLPPNPAFARRAHPWKKMKPRMRHMPRPLGRTVSGPNPPRPDGECSAAFPRVARIQGSST